MARQQFNIFRRVAATLGNSYSDLYKTPAGKAGIILTAQAANVGASTRSVTLAISGSDGTITELAESVLIPSYDSRSLIIGKIVLAEGDTILASEGSSSAEVKVNLS